MCKEDTVKSEEWMRRTRGEERIRVRKKKSRRGVQMQERTQDTRKKEQQMSRKKEDNTQGEELKSR